MPMTLSASQCPNPLRSSASGGRSTMETLRDREPRHPTARMLAPPVAARQASGPVFAARLAGIDPSVDGLRAHAHGIVAGEQDAQPAADGRRRPAAAQLLRHPRPQPVMRQAMRLARFGAPPGGLALGRPGDVIAARPRPGLEPPGPIGTAGFALVGREPRVALDLTADGGRAAPDHRADRPYAGPVADLDQDDLAFLFRQVRIYFPHRCNIPSDWLSGQSPITGVALSIRQRANNSLYNCMQ